MKKTIWNKLTYSLLLVVALILTSKLFWAQLEGHHVLKVKEEPLKSSDSILNFFREQAPSWIDFLNPNVVLVSSMRGSNNLTPLLILSGHSSGKVLWLNGEAINWFSSSPNGRYIAYYPGSIHQKGIWVVDLKEKRSKLVVPELLKGKQLSVTPGMFLDDEHIIIERIDAKLYQQGTETDFLSSYYKGLLALSEEERKRFEKLDTLFWQSKLKQEEFEEYMRLLSKVISMMSPEDRKAMEQADEALSAAFSGQEVYIVDIINGEEKLLFKGGEVIGLSQDARWVYVRDVRSNKVYKVSPVNPNIKEELLNLYYPFLRIKSDAPLQYGFPYPSLIRLGVATKPSAYRCYCYEKKDGTIALRKIIKIGDERFPPDARLSVPKNGMYVLAISDSGFYLKEIEKGTIRKIENADVSSYNWNSDHTKLVYAKRSKMGYEIWLYDLLSHKKTRLFP
ncbi:hypothetical protein H5T88_05185 [bacterium]|nr:hypothetical protein [bacterium]